MLEHNENGGWEIGFHDEFFDEFGTWREGL
jgi:hypothetical protein